MFEHLSLLSFASGGWGSALVAGALVTWALASRLDVSPDRGQGATLTRDGLRAIGQHLERDAIEAGDVGDRVVSARAEDTRRDT